MIVDFILDHFTAVIIIICIVFICLVTKCSVDEKKECEKKGGLAVPNMYDYHCYTKEDLKKIRGVK